MNGGSDPGAELITLLERERSNRLRIYVTLAVVLAAMTGILLDAFWFPWTTAGSRMLPFLGLVVVCVGGLWFADKLSRENQRLAERISVLAEGLEGRVQEKLSTDQQAALEAQLSFNRRLAYALVGVGFIGALSLAGAMVMSVDRVLENFWTAVAILGVAGVCVLLAMWWAWRGRRIWGMMERMGVNEDREGQGEQDWEDH